MGSKSAATRKLPAYGIWHAHQLQPRDLLFGSFMLLTFCLYLFKTVPAACSIGPDLSSAAHDTVHVTNTEQQQQQQQWPLAWRFFCRKPFAPFNWPSPSNPQQSSVAIDPVFNQCTNPTATGSQPDAVNNVAKANAQPQDRCPQQPQQQLDESEAQSNAAAKAWKRQAASTVKGRLKGWAGKVLSKCVGLLLAGLQVSTGNSCLLSTGSSHASIPV
jgi:hypothetical protein